MLKKKGDGLREVRKLSFMAFLLTLFFLSPVVVFFYQQRGLDFFQILALESILVAFIFLFEVPTGLFADKYGRKKSIIIGTFLLALEPLIFIFAPSFIWFAVSFAVAGIGMAFLSGTAEALIYDHLKSQKKEKLMKKAMGMYGSAALFAMIIAPIIGSYIAKELLMSQFMILLYMTLFFAVMGFLMSFTIKDTRKKKVNQENPFKILKQGINVIRHDRSLLRIILLFVFANPFTYTLHYLYQPYLKDAGVNIAFFGSIFAIALILTAFTQRYSYKIEKVFGMKKAVLMATLMPGIIYILMAFTHNVIFSTTLFILAATFAGIGLPLFSDYQNQKIPSKVRATVLSLTSLLVSFYLIFMRLIIGKIADTGVNYAFIFMGAVIIIFSLLLRIDEKHVS